MKEPMPINQHVRGSIDVANVNNHQEI